MRAPPWAADELAWAGFDAVTAATNHAGDYSHGGMEATMRALESRTIPYAGLGRSLAEAREPAYVDAPTGRVGVVAACSTVTPGDEAGMQRPDLQGRPGVSPLSLDARYVVDEATHDRLAGLSETLGLEAVKERAAEFGFPVPGEDDEGLTLLNAGRGDDLQFVVGDDPGVELSPSASDRDAVLAQIRAADRQAEVVVASLHAHEGEGAFRNDHSVPAWLETFAHDCVDAGADAFVGHGPHVLRGVELYAGAPIFYSLGDFVMENETVGRLPAEIYERYDLDPLAAQPADLYDARVFDEDGGRKGFLADRAFWESVVPVCTFGDDGVERVECLPVELGYEEPRGRRGEPRLAEGEAATRILEDLADLSAPFGTELTVDGGVGVVRP
jgi:poly-gamma-glutamate synthesis protein (capsule biosynthesis protein)